MFLVFSFKLRYYNSGNTVLVTRGKVQIRNIQTHWRHAHISENNSLNVTNTELSVDASKGQPFVINEITFELNKTGQSEVFR